MMDGGAILKPALGRARLRCIGATTIDKFKKTIEKDPALERRWGEGCFAVQRACGVVCYPVVCCCHVSACPHTALSQHPACMR